MRLSDMIEEMIQQMLAEADGIAEIQRNELANKLGCVPSQINYVITSRFTPEQGYIVESRRGGGGFIRIIRKVQSGNDMLTQVINAIGDRLNEETSRIYISNLFNAGAISEEADKLLRAASSAQVYRGIPQPLRDTVRASVIKHMLITLVDSD
ncbi:transcriptional repressor CtsR [[Clostridium] cellulosi]|uniref:Transcriptional repressor CtsR n=1 Tax=[Clostridium] cellulosi TaxID=29343 RepID=A0A078KR71_9FIRM|nr:transcriptional repressor CtsR [[Clostridium] cellulosi]